jgi:outer membrane biosynthesis protein TonB
VCIALKLCAQEEKHSREEANMKRLLTTCSLFAFWASPNNSIYDMILRSSSWASDRKSKLLNPGFPVESPTEQPPIRPVRPIPTDVPVPDPKDVPVREPRDVPPPDASPKPIKPVPTKPDPKPRPTP